MIGMRIIFVRGIRLHGLLVLNSLPWVRADSLTVHILDKRAGARIPHCVVETMANCYCSILACDDGLLKTLVGILLTRGPSLPSSDSDENELLSDCDRTVLQVVSSRHTSYNRQYVTNVTNVALYQNMW